MPPDRTPCPAGEGDFRLVPQGDKWTVGRFHTLEGLPHIVHAVTTRRGPDVDRVRADPAWGAAEFTRLVGAKDAAWVEQVHGGQVVVVDRAGLAGQADGMVTETPSLALVCRSADCPLILLADRSRAAVGIVHASWRATVAGIPITAISALRDAFGVRPADVVACIGPSAGPCCYEVGPEVLQAALKQAAMKVAGRCVEVFYPKRGGKPHFDLWIANANQLVRAGVRAENVHFATVCTICGGGEFPSYRREGNAAGRFMAGIAACCPGSG